MQYSFSEYGEKNITIYEFVGDKHVQLLLITNQKDKLKEFIKNIK